MAMRERYQREIDELKETISESERKIESLQDTSEALNLSHSEALNESTQKFSQLLNDKLQTEEALRITTDNLKKEMQ